MTAPETVERGIPVQLLHEVFRLDVDTGQLYWRQSGRGRSMTKPAGSTHNRGYRRVSVGPAGSSVEMLVHRAVFAMHNGYWPEHDVDHINQVKDDNRPCNLRAATRTENMQNVDWSAAPRRSRNRSGFTGVHWHKATGKWCADIYRNRQTYTVGYFSSPEEAAAARAAEIAQWP